MSSADSSTPLLTPPGHRAPHVYDVDDDLSSHASSHLRLSASTLPTSNHKRPRPSSTQTSVCSDSSPAPQYFSMVCALTFALDTLYEGLQIGLTDNGLPASSISPPVHSCAIQSPSQSDDKLVYFRILDPSILPHILQVVRATIRHSMPQLTTVLPPSPDIDDVDLTPFPGPGHPLFCCVTSCPYHNGREPLFSNCIRGVGLAQAHGNCLHIDLLASLPSDALSSIGWSRCCDACPTFFLSADDLHTHRSSCALYVPPPPHAIDASSAAPPPHRDPKWSTLYIICPTSRHPDLDSLITSAPDADPSSLFTTVTRWFNDFASSNGATTASPSTAP